MCYDFRRSHAALHNDPLHSIRFSDVREDMNYIPDRYNFGDSLFTCTLNKVNQYISA